MAAGRHDMRSGPCQGGLGGCDWTCLQFPPAAETIPHWLAQPWLLPRQPKLCLRLALVHLVKLALTTKLRVTSFGDTTNSRIVLIACSVAKRRRQVPVALRNPRRGQAGGRSKFVAAGSPQLGSLTASHFRKFGFENSPNPTVTTACQPRTTPSEPKRQMHLLPPIRVRSVLATRHSP